MIGLILVAHGEIATSLLDATSKICGPPHGVRAITLGDPIDEQALLKRILDARKELDQGDGVLILTDMFGGTPSNICFSLLQERAVEVLTGMNLPMIVKLMTLRQEKNLQELVAIALECGRENIYSAREILNRTRKG